MKITAIYGTSHTGSTVLLARILMQSLPKDNSSTFSPTGFQSLLQRLLRML